MPTAERLSIHDVDPKAYEPMLAMEKYIHAGGLGEDLLALIKIRASQLNGCAYCLDMHGREARNAGVSNRRLDVLAGWREAPSLYSDRERAAIDLTESMTLIGEAGVGDDVWAAASSEFSESEMVTLVMAICAINVWNRMAVATNQPLPDADGEAE